MTRSSSSSAALPSSVALPDNVILSVENLDVCFAPNAANPVRAVRNVSLQIGHGETLALVGESGSGKSVTAMTIMRLTEFDGASITGGRILMRMKDRTIVDLTKLSDKRIEALRGFELSIVFQDPMSSLNPVFTVADQIMEAVIRHQKKTSREARQIALNVLKLVRVPDAERRLDQYPHQLSVLFITHDMGVVAEIADRVCVMLKGEIVETGSVHDIFNNPKHRYTSALISAVPRLGSMADKPGPEKFPLLVYEEESARTGTAQ